MLSIKVDWSSPEEFSFGDELDDEFSVGDEFEDEFSVVDWGKLLLG